MAEENTQRLLTLSHLDTLAPVPPRFDMAFGKAVNKMVNRLAAHQPKITPLQAAVELTAHFQQPISEQTLKRAANDMVFTRKILAKASDFTL